MRRAVPIAVLLLAAAIGGCQPRTEAPAAQATTPADTSEGRPDDGSERGNLLQLANGATVVDHTGELSLNVPALFAIDGNRDTLWSTPPNDIAQSVTVALGAKTRVTKLGFSNEYGLSSSRRLRTLVYESSTDGVTFRPLATVTAPQAMNAFLADVPPTECSVLRATVVAAFTPQSGGLDVPSLQMRGEELATPPPLQLAGCWSINQGSGSLSLIGGHLFGRVELDGLAMEIDGGSKGRMARFAWMRNREYGVGVMTASPDGRALNALLWHEEPLPIFFDQPWFGKRAATPCGAATPSGATFGMFLSRAGRFPLYGLLIDGSGAVDAKASGATLDGLARFLLGNRSHPFQLVAHEFHSADAAANRRISTKTIETLRTLLAGPLHGDFTNLELVAAGSDHPRHPVTNETEQALYSSVDLVTRRH